MVLFCNDENCLAFVSALKLASNHFDIKKNNKNCVFLVDSTRKKWILFCFYSKFMYQMKEKFSMKMKINWITIQLCMNYMNN